MLTPLADLISFAIRIYSLIIIVRAIVSWVSPDPYNPIVRILYRLTEPVLAPIRKVQFRMIGNIGIDFSPFIAIILIQVIGRFVIRLLLF